jgi:hypothetical protein
VRVSAGVVRSVSPLRYGTVLLFVLVRPLQQEAVRDGTRAVWGRFGSWVASRPNTSRRVAAISSTVAHPLPRLESASEA